MSFSGSKQKSVNTSQQTSNSLNQAYPFLQGALGDQVSNVGAGTNAIRSILGLDGSTSQNEGFQRFKDSSGYNFVQEEGVKGITGNAAAKGLLGSGSVLRGINKYSSNLADNFLNSYLEKLLGLSQTGLGAAQVLSSAGNTAQSQGNSVGSSSGSSNGFSFG